MTAYDWVDEDLLKFIVCSFKDFGFESWNVPIFTKQLLEDIRSGRPYIYATEYSNLVAAIRSALEVPYTRLPLYVGRSDLFDKVLQYRLEVGR